MKKTFMNICFAASTIVASLLVTTLSAQSIEQTMRPWDAGKLTWDEFLGEAKGDTAINMFSWNTEYSQGKQKIGNTTYTYPKFTTYFDQTESWTLPQFKTDVMLQYNQLLFDMLELYSRRATIELNKNTDYTYQQLRSFYRRQFDKRAREIKEETRNGTDGTKLPYYAADIALDLERTYFDPAQVLDNTTQHFSGEFYVGASSMFPISDYYKQTFGFNLGFGLGWNRHLWGMDLSLGFSGDAKQDVWTHNGWIYEGESLNYFQVYLTYAYLAAQNAHFQTYPYIGLGANGFNHPLGKDYEGDNPEKDGFSLCAGMMFDIFLNRRVNINSAFSNDLADVGYRAIRLKPYFSMTYYDDIGWTPALNLTISFNWGGYTLH